MSAFRSEKAENCPKIFQSIEGFKELYRWVSDSSEESAFNSKEKETVFVFVSEVAQCENKINRKTKFK